MASAAPVPFAPGAIPPTTLPPNTLIRPPKPKPLLLFITNVKSAETAWVEISIYDNIKMLKNYVSRKMHIPVDRMVLIYMGEELKDEYLVKDCRLDRVIQKVAAREEPTADDSTLHLIDLKDTRSTVRNPTSSQTP
eukprot:CAMPEP_0171101270 /NCGR_PEP_ID=MMETSP0766_2-20121228/54461_1 /TAXON_ID=439317 /ORGANISM="Gambierdiscus australes, Strain CAWD 149" /LENGTH=135 /DNA_ID=CAMNT_0011561279 /DNA_START=73 /DNA_END=480 /DNA_ORIENTATION=+